MKAPVNKIFLPIAEKPILYWTLSRIAQIPSLIEIVLVYHSKEEVTLRNLIATIFSPVPILLVEGGLRRQDSLANGARSTNSHANYLLLHDAVRPFCQQSRLLQVCHAAQKTGASLLVEPITSTVKRKKGEFLETLDRSHLYLAQTPQVIRRDLYLKAIEAMYQFSWDVTDDISLVEQLKHPVQTVEGDSYNIKITFPTDLPLANFIHQHYFQSTILPSEKGTS